MQDGLWILRKLINSQLVSAFRCREWDNGRVFLLRKNRVNGLRIRGAKRVGGISNHLSLQDETQHLIVCNIVTISWLMSFVAIPQLLQPRRHVSFSFPETSMGVWLIFSQRPGLLSAELFRSSFCRTPVVVVPLLLVRSCLNHQPVTRFTHPSFAFFLQLQLLLQGNGATDGCCSKCWRDLQKKQAPHAVAAPKPAVAVKEEEPPQPMEVEPLAASPKKEDTPAATPVKKKKKKASYKNMMASMMKGEERDIEKEKEALRKVTGGGAFSKIDKI